MTVMTAALDNAVGYVKRNGRPLEKELLGHFMEGGPLDGVWRELEKYQNQDGGFGRALEPDLRCQASSACATSIGFQVLRRCDASSALPVCAKAVGYLLRTLNAKSDVWLQVPPELDSAPHAPWWRYGTEAETPFANPGAELVGYLWDHAALVPKDVLERLTEKAMAELATAKPEMEMHDFQCYARLVETPSLPCATREKALRYLKEAAARTVVLEEEGWAKYGLKPLSFIVSPDSPFAEPFADAVRRNIRFELERQQPDGSWGPNWKWGDDVVWARVEAEWRSILTLRMITILKNFKSVWD